MSMKIKRPDYAAQYGPTTGDKVYLAESGLGAELEHDECYQVASMFQLMRFSQHQAHLPQHPKLVMDRRVLQ